MKYLAIILSIVIFLGCNKNTEPEQLEYKMYISSGNSTIAIGEQSEITLQILNIPQPVFGMSLQLDYDSSIIGINDSLGFSNGDFFGQNAIAFAKEEESKIYLSFSKVQGESPASGSGKICTITFTGITAGSSLVQFLYGEINYYDSAGEIIPMSNLNYESIEIIVQ